MFRYWNMKQEYIDIDAFLGEENPNKYYKQIKWRVDSLLSWEN